MDFLAIVIQLATLASIVVGIYVSLRNGKKIEANAKQMNGKLSELIEAKETIAHAAGVTEGEAKS